MFNRKLINANNKSFSSSTEGKCKLKPQQAETDRLMQVMQQWSAEGQCQYYHTQANYNASRGRSHSRPNMSSVHHNRSPQYFNEFEHQRYGYQDRRYQHHHRQEPDQRRYSHVSQSASRNTNGDAMSIMLGTLERLGNFTAKVSVQLMAQLVLGSIPDFNS